MSEIYLHRDDAPFGPEIWAQIDAAVVESAKSQLTARRLLAVEGPFGLGLKSVANSDKAFASKSEDAVNVSFSTALPLAMIQKTFTLAARDIAAFEKEKVALDLSAAVKASIDCAKQENELIFSGAKGFFAGLLNSTGVQSYKLKGWTAVGKAVEDIISAINQLDAAGFHGPYALALTPELYNALFRLYPQGNTTEMEHLKGLVTGGIFKAPGLASAGVLIATGKQFASIIMGQDLTTGFIGPVVGGYEFSITESFTLRVMASEAVCVLK